jgi:hypothetical protein
LFVHVESDGSGQHLIGRRCHEQQQHCPVPAMPNNARARALLVSHYCHRLTGYSHPCRVRLIGRFINPFRLTTIALLDTICYHHHTTYTLSISAGLLLCSLGAVQVGCWRCELWDKLGLAEGEGGERTAAKSSWVSCSSAAGRLIDVGSRLSNSRASRVVFCSGWELLYQVDCIEVPNSCV